MATSPFPFLRLPAELRIMIYEAVSNDCDMFYMMRYLLHGNTSGRLTRASSRDRTDIWGDSWRDSYWNTSMDSTWDSPHGTKQSAKAILQLLMTSRQIRAEALPVLSGLKLCVGVPKGINSWRAAVVRDTTENVISIQHSLSPPGSTSGHGRRLPKRRNCWYNASAL